MSPIKLIIFQWVKKIYSDLAKNLPNACYVFPSEMTIDDEKYDISYFLKHLLINHNDTIDRAFTCSFNKLSGDNFVKIYTLFTIRYDESISLSFNPIPKPCKK
jgi:hypothetical protein